MLAKNPSIEVLVNCKTGLWLSGSKLLLKSRFYFVHLAQSCRNIKYHPRVLSLINALMNYIKFKTVVAEIHLWLGVYKPQLYNLCVFTNNCLYMRPCDSTNARESGSSIKKFQIGICNSYINRCKSESGSVLDDRGCNDIIDPLDVATWTPKLLAV